MASTATFGLEKSYFRKRPKIADTTKRVNTTNFMPKEDQTKKEITFQSVKISKKVLAKAQKTRKLLDLRVLKIKNCYSTIFQTANAFTKSA